MRDEQDEQDQVFKLASNYGHQSILLNYNLTCITIIVGKAALKLSFMDVHLMKVCII